VKSYQLYVDGAFIDAQGSRMIDVINPATQDVIARVPDADAVDVSVAVAAARRAFDAGPWRRVPRRSADEFCFDSPRS
jgi:acyl-CoA reductase-like NAD-dependent aldehyde dehydrogenase